MTPRLATPAAVIATAGADLAAQTGALPAWAPPVIVGFIVVIVQGLANRNIANLDAAVKAATDAANAAKSLAENVATRLGVAEGEIGRLREHYHDIASDVTTVNAMLDIKKKGRK